MILIGKNLQLNMLKIGDCSNMAPLIIHLYATLLNSDSMLIMPFKRLLINPNEYTRSFLPAMPDDELFELSSMQLKNTTNLKKTKTKSPIKSNDYGFCLSDTKINDIKVESLRGLSSLEVLILRLILSCTLYISELIGNDIKSLITKYKGNNVTQYLAGHIMQNLNALSNCLQHSIDEVVLLMHHLFNNLPNMLKFTGNPDDSKWSTKHSRDDYERRFSTEIIQPIINTHQIDDLFEHLINKLKENTTQSQILSVSYDLLQSSSLVNEKPYWFYRTYISIDSFIRSLCAQKSAQLNVLKQFFENIYQFELIKYLPSLIRMINLLYSVYNRQIGRKEASNVCVKQLLEENSDAVNIFKNSTSNKLTIINGSKSFLIVWNRLKHYLVEKNFYLNFNNYKINQNLNADDIQLNDNDCEKLKLSHLLPTFIENDNDIIDGSNNGRHIYIIVYYLCTLQNEFLNFYKNELNKRLIDDQHEETNKLNEIELNEINSNNSLKFSIQTDILNIIHMNSIYALDPVSDAMNIEYNFNKIQSSIETRLLNNKPIVNRKVCSKSICSVFIFKLNLFIFI